MRFQLLYPAWMSKYRMRKPYLEIACQQILTGDSSVFSVQWIDLPAAAADALTPGDLLARYLDYINGCTLSVIRPVTLEQGIEFRLLGTNLSLISFQPPSYGDGHALLRIRGGFLVQPRQHNRGELRFGVEPFAEGVRVSLQLSEFCPLLLGNRPPSLLGFWLYRLTQAAIHRLVTIRFLAQLGRDVAEYFTGVRIVNVAVREGRPV